MPAPHSRLFSTGIAAILTVGLACANLPAQTGQAAAQPAGATTAPASVQSPLPLDAVAPSVVAVAWSRFGEPVAAAATTPLPTPHNPATLFHQTMLRALQDSSGAISTAQWQAGDVAKRTAEPEALAEMWRQRLVAHRAVAGLALTPNKPGTPTAAAPVTIAEGLVLLNSLRQQAPEAMDTGAEGRLLRAINFINARSVYISAVVPAVPPRVEPHPPAKPDAAAAAAHTLANTPLVRLAISWSSRSEPQERCRAVAIGEAAVSATDWPSDIAPGPWVLAIRPNAYYGSLGSGLGNYLRYAVAMKTASEPGNSRGPESPVTSVSPVTSDQCTAISRGADRTFFVTTIDGVATVLLPCRGPDEAGAALAAAAKLLGVTPDAKTTTPWGGVKLIRLGQRCIALQLLPAK